MIQKKENMYDQFTSQVRGQLEKRFTRERDFDKRKKEERDYDHQMNEERTIKHREHLTKKQRLEHDYLRSLKEEEAKTIVKINEHNKKREERLVRVARETAQKS